MDSLQKIRRTYEHLKFFPAQETGYSIKRAVDSWKSRKIVDKQREIIFKSI